MAERLALARRTIIASSVERHWPRYDITGSDEPSLVYGGIVMVTGSSLGSSWRFFGHPSRRGPGRFPWRSSRRHPQSSSVVHPRRHPNRSSSASVPSVIPSSDLLLRAFLPSRIVPRPRRPTRPLGRPSSDGSLGSMLLRPVPRVNAPPTGPSDGLSPDQPVGSPINRPHSRFVWVPRRVYTVGSVVIVR